MIEGGLSQIESIELLTKYDNEDRMEGIDYIIQQKISFPKMAVRILSQMAEEILEEEGDDDSEPAAKIEKLYKIIRNIRNKYKL